MDLDWLRIEAGNSTEEWPSQPSWNSTLPPQILLLVSAQEVADIHVVQKGRENNNDQQQELVQGLGKRVHD